MIPDSRKYNKITTHVLQEMKLKGEKIAMLTAYDFSFATLLEEAGIAGIGRLAMPPQAPSGILRGEKLR